MFLRSWPMGLTIQVSIYLLIQKLPDANFLPGASPALGQLNLPGSPHVDGSPAQAPGMLPQHSQQTHSSGHSAQTSPMQTNKRRRPSAVKVEDDGIVNGTAPKTSNSVKASPRVGGKRQKGNPA